MNNIGIYSIININGKRYIGQSNNLKRRKSQHLNSLRANRHGMVYRNGKLTGEIDHLQKAWNKYGEEAFKWEILEYCREDILTEREQFYMDKYNSYNPSCGYNIHPRADKTIISEETRKKMSDKKKGYIPWHKGKKMTKEYCIIASKSQLGKKHTPETKEKCRQASTGRCHTKETREKIRQGNLGKKHSKEHIEKCRQIKLGKKITEEHKEKVRQAHLGKRKYEHLVNEWQELKIQGLTYKEIGEKYNINIGVINTYLTIYYPLDIPRKMSLRVRKRMSDARKGRKMSDEFKEKIRKFRTGQTHTEETKEKIRNSMRKKQVL